MNPAVLGVDIIFERQLANSKADSDLMIAFFEASQTIPIVMAEKLSSSNWESSNYTYITHSFFSEEVGLEEGSVNVTAKPSEALETYPVYLTMGTDSVYSFPAKIVEALTGNKVIPNKGREHTINYDAVTFNINVTRNVVLDETSTIAPTAVTGVNVRVKRSIKANEWSKICLPFAMNTTQVKAAFGSDVALADFNDYVYDETKNIITVKFQDAFAIEANHPYIIRVSEGITEFTVDGVDIDPVEEPKINLGSNHRPHAIVGTYVANTTLEYGTLFLNGNKFWYSVGNTKMKAFRAYFNFYDLLSDFDENYESRIAMSFESETTGIAEIENGKLPIDNSAYDLQGRKVLKPVKGLYIRNGRKEVAK
jgi:hypothetical protein